MEGVREGIVFLYCVEEYRRALVDYPIVVVRQIRALTKKENYAIPTYSEHSFWGAGF